LFDLHQMHPVDDLMYVNSTTPMQAYHDSIN